MHSGSIDKHSVTTVAKPSRKLMIEFGLRRNALPTVETMELDSSKESEANDSEEKFLSEDDSGIQPSPTKYLLQLKQNESVLKQPEKDQIILIYKNRRKNGGAPTDKKHKIGNQVVQS